MSDPGFIFEQPDDAPYIVLWKRGAHREVAHFTLAEAFVLQRSLQEAIDDLRELLRSERDC